jgi:hypothetical protein
VLEGPLATANPDGVLYWPAGFRARGLRQHQHGASYRFQRPCERHDPPACLRSERRCSRAERVMTAIILAYRINQALTAANDYQRRRDRGPAVGAATALACGKLDLMRINWPMRCRSRSFRAFPCASLLVVGMAAPA